MARTCYRLSEVFTQSVDGVGFTWVSEDVEDMPDVVLRGHVSDERAVQAAIKAIGIIDGLWAPDVHESAARVVYEWTRFLIHNQGCGAQDRDFYIGCNCDEYGWWIDSSPKPKPFSTPTTRVSFRFYDTTQRTIPTPQEV